MAIGAVDVAGGEAHPTHAGIGLGKIRVEAVSRLAVFSAISTSVSFPVTSLWFM